MKKPVFTVISAILCLLVSGCSEQADNTLVNPNTTNNLALSINWTGTDFIYDSTNTNKHDLALLYFRSNDCEWGDSLELLTFTDSSVIAELNSNFDIAFLNTSSDSLCGYFDTMFTANQFFKDIYNLVGVPSFLVLDKNCGYVGRIRGYSPPEEFIDRLNYFTTQ